MTGLQDGQDPWRRTGRSIVGQTLQKNFGLMHTAARLTGTEQGVADPLRLHEGDNVDDGEADGEDGPQH